MPIIKARLLLLMLLPSIGPAYAASFDCVKASSPVEQAICQDGFLSSLDEILASTYQEAWSIVPDQQGLRQSQREWLVQRDQCSDIDCITASIQQRNQQLKTYVATLKEEASKQAYAAEVEAWAVENAARRAVLAEGQATAEVAEQKPMPATLEAKDLAAESAAQLDRERQEIVASQELADASYAADYAEHAYIREKIEPEPPKSKSLNWGYWWVGVVFVVAMLIGDRITRFLYPSSDSISAPQGEDIDDSPEIIARTDSNELPRLQQSTFRVGMPPIAKACGSCKYWSGHRFSHPKLGRNLLVNKDERGECNYRRPGGRRINLRPTDGTQCPDFTSR